jgi:hypothetical protein
MKILFCLLLSLVFFSQAFSQNYKQIKIFPDGKEDVERILNLGINLDDAEFSKDNGLTFFVSDEEFINISALGISFNVLIDNWFAYYESLPKLTEIEKDQIREKV